MTTVTADRAVRETFADRLRDLGDVPASRVLWLGRPATEDDLLRFVETKGRRVELVDGLLVEKAMGFSEGLLAGWLITLLNNFVVPRRLGFVSGADCPNRLGRGLVRLPDVAFVSHGWLPAVGAHRRAVAEFAPELAVEVLSRKNTRREIARKRREYFAAGTRLVWIVNPRAETVAVYTDADAHTILSTDDTLTGGDVLPGFQLPVADLFGYLDQLPPEPPAADAPPTPPAG